MVNIYSLNPHGHTGVRISGFRVLCRLCAPRPAKDLSDLMLAARTHHPILQRVPPTLAELLPRVAQHSHTIVDEPHAMQIVSQLFLELLMRIRGRGPWWRPPHKK